MRSASTARRWPRRARHARRDGVRGSGRARGAGGMSRPGAPRYVPEDSLQSPRFTGPSTFARLPYVRTLEDVDLAVVGVPFDTGVTYRAGGRFGPNAVRAASVMLRPVQPEPRRQAVRHPVVRRLRRRLDRPGLHRAQLRGDRGDRRPDRRGRRRPAAHRRRPRLHAAAPAGDALARARGGHRLRLAHRRLGQLLRREVQPRDVDAPGHRGGPRRRRPLDRGRAARLGLRRRATGPGCATSSVSTT